MSSGITAALLEFVRVIDSTGGVIDDPEGDYDAVPAADPEWGDLGDAYLQACKALGREPMKQESEQ